MVGYDCNERVSYKVTIDICTEEIHKYRSQLKVGKRKSFLEKKTAELVMPKKFWKQSVGVQRSKVLYTFLIHFDV